MQKSKKSHLNTPQPKIVTCPICKRSVTAGGPSGNVWTIQVHARREGATGMCSGTDMKVEEK